MGSLVIGQVAHNRDQHDVPGHMMGGGDSHAHEDGTASYTSPPSDSPTRARSSNTPPIASEPPSEPSLPPQTTPPQAHGTPPDVEVASRTNSRRDAFRQPSPALAGEPSDTQSSPSSPRLGPTHRSTLSLAGSEASSPSKLKVRDLAHIQSFASQEYLNRGRLAGRILETNKQFEISAMPVSDIIEMVAGLLTKITNTNDRQHDHVHRPITPSDGVLSSTSSCVLAFHGKNVPSITILSYLSRIHKYCPTTYEVFLSLLVYFDRMTDNFNKRYLEKANAQSRRSESSDSYASSVTLTEDNMDQEPRRPRPTTEEEGQKEGQDINQFFVVDSYNIHRLVIAGVTCASKFFSDVFYTNSRYAKVSCRAVSDVAELILSGRWLASGRAQQSGTTVSPLE